MRKHLLAAGLAAATLIPSAAFAQQTCEQRSANRAVGTLAGAGIGALLGSAIAGHGDHTTGAVIGGVGGAIAGNQIAKGSADCTHAYGFYDNNGAWHANAIPAAQASGYYDRSGDWVSGAPNGYYDSQSRWVAGRAETSAAGYTDARGRFVPVSASGYYDTDGRWVAGSASGHYDGNGRWMAGPTIGRYDSNGRWMAGEASGHRDANGNWVADAQPGYYEGGRWHAGQTYGYYDTRGGWHSASGYVPTSDLRQTANWRGAPNGFKARQSWLQSRIEQGLRNGALGRQNANRALSDLSDLRRDERGMRHYEHGQLGRKDEQRLQARLDDVNAGLRWSRSSMARQE